MRAHEAPLRRYLRRLAGDDADDLAQETFLAAWRALGQWRGEGSFGGWLRTIATRRFLDACRRAGHAAQTTIDTADTAVAAGDIEQRIAIDRALAALPPRERSAALLVFGEGHSHSEACEILDVPLGTLKSLVARARLHLIPLLGGTCP